MKSLALTSLFIATLLLGCSGRAEDGPPHVRWGQDECAHCGMIVTDERFAAALRVVTEGEQRDLAFDDIGDMIAYEREHNTLDIRKRFVKDFETKQWTDASSAAFVQNDQTHTPMGSGIIAFTRQAHAEACAARSGGKVLNLSALTTKPQKDKLCTHCNQV
jgi:copper chaperone NosL